MSFYAAACVMAGPLLFGVGCYLLGRRDRRSQR